MGYGRDEYDRVAAAMAYATCGHCGKQDHTTELYRQAIPGTNQVGQYCRNIKACHQRTNNNRKKEPMQFGEYTQPEQTEGDTYKPREHYGNSCIIKVLEHKPEIITPNSPNGAPGVICDVYDLNLKQAFRDVLMMTGAIVDGFKTHVGKNPIVIAWEKRVAKNGRDYPAPAPAVAAAVKAAQDVYAAGDPFAPTLGTVDEAEAPF